MRLIVACPKCKRQYDASARKPGTRFRCSCGAAVKIARPRGHDAAVVRCSSCGAPRVMGAAACNHCESDFTVHERDLDTVCPSCLARVSDQARYCHHCATPLTAEMVAGDQSSASCPACRLRHQLVTRRLGDYPVPVLECPGCVGLWLGISELDHLFEHESRLVQRAVVHASSAERKPAARGYRPCAMCDDLMMRRNFGRGKSGVIVDVCGLHGVWFDADELSHLVAWTRAGGLEQARLDLAQLRNSKDIVRKRAASLFDRSSDPGKESANRIGSGSQPGWQGRDISDATWLDLLTSLAAHTIFH